MTTKDESSSTATTADTRAEILIRNKLIRMALVSRFSLIALAAVSNALLPDHNAGVFTWSRDKNIGMTAGDRIVDFFTEGLTRWDGQYFLHIANHGYTFENTLAFFPLFPMAVRSFAEVVFWLQSDYGLLNFESALKLSATAINVAAFVSTTLLLYDLSKRVLKDVDLAYRSALFFCFNPASTFFSAHYSESLHFLLTTYVMLKVERGLSIQTGLLLALCTATRANAILTILFALHKGLKVICYELALHSRLKQLKKADVSETIANVLEDAVWPMISSCGALISVILFQWHGYTQFCALTKNKLNMADVVVDYATKHGLKLPTAQPSEWCHATLPISYSYVQSAYWDVGFLRFYQLKHWPAFVAAAPIAVLIIGQAMLFWRRHKHFCLTLGLAPGEALGRLQNGGRSKIVLEDNVVKRVLPRECFVYVVHAAALCIFSLLCAHVQITTRLICSGSPVFYWIAALLTAPKILKKESNENLKSWWRCNLVDESCIKGPAVQVKWFCIVYFILGTMLFANWLPFT